MGFRFRRSVRLLPGIRLNFSTRGVSTSVGGRGFTLNFGKRGIRTTVGIPGTGISYSEMLTRNSNGDSGATNATPPAAGSSIGCGTFVVIVLVVLGLARLIGGPTDAGNSASNASAPAPPPSLQVPMATVTAKVLKCRAASNAKARVLRRLPRGTLVEQLEHEQGWVRVIERAAGLPSPLASSCWVAERFLRPN
jgi:hypothetical protein